MKAYIKFLFLPLLGLACTKIMPPAPLEQDILDGPVAGLTAEENRQFLMGDVAFNDEIFTSQNGLGPLFVANSCASCHAGDGKGHPFSTLIRFGQTDSSGNPYLDQGAPQLQNRAIPGYQPENLPSGVTYARILPPANTGLGFLDAVSDKDILAKADPLDADGDGISGVPNWIKVPYYCTLRNSAISQGQKYIGRFGKKSGAYDLLQQTANAYNQDIGITTAYEPMDTYSKQIVEPELSSQTVLDVVFYLKTLKAPVPRNSDDPEVQAGKMQFRNLSCNKCHLEELHTGNSSISALSNKTFYPYTDLLLHDMGPELDDKYTEGSAKSSEWRTPALWGLGLSKSSQGGSYFLLHDGRASSIDDAIMLHGGEGEHSKSLYKNLPENEKKQLITFLESL